MIHHELLDARGILILKPDGALRAEEFSALAAIAWPLFATAGGACAPPGRQPDCRYSASARATMSCASRMMTSRCAALRKLSA